MIGLAKLEEKANPYIQNLGGGVVLKFMFSVYRC